jgi:hypothetical protein
MIRTLLASVLAAFFLASSPAQAAVWKSVDSWDIEYAGDSCYTLNTYQDGTVFGFRLGKDGQFDLAVANSTWNIGAGDQLALVKVDDADWSKHTATAVSGQTLLISLVPEPESVRVLRVGALIKIRLGTEELRYKLTGTRQMLPELVACAGALNKISFL